jgi:hypothetical protein
MADPSVTSNQATTVIANRFTGDYRVDVLLEDPNFRWNAPQPPGSPVEVTYSFAAAAPDYAAASDKNGFSVFTDSQMAAARQAFNDIAQQFNITFKEVADTVMSYGQIRLGNNAQGATSAGYAFYPDPSLGPNAGDVYINNEDPDNLSNVIPGTNAYATIVHEIGHALGIKHPGNYNAGEPASPAPGNFLAKSEDSEANTIMSYVKVPQAQERDFFGSYDILALQYLYGSRPYNTGANAYALGDSVGQKLQLIIDTVGVDTLDASGATAATTIDLREGKASSIGRLADGAAALNNVSIAFGTVIENAIGTSGSDTITGNSTANALTGGGGNDNIDGGAGVDTVVFSGPRSAYTAASGGALWTIADTTAGRDGTDTLTNVERLKFSDVMVALDTGGNAGSVAKILGAVFGASFVINKQFVGIGLSLVDGGMSYAGVMKLALDAKLGAGFTNDAEVKLLYQNLLGTAPSQNDLAFWTGTISSNQFTQVSLAVMAADTSINTDNIKLTGLAATGLEYTPLA